MPKVIRDYHQADMETAGMMHGQQTTEFLHLLNPKNYKFLPPQYAKSIRSAGKVTANSNHVKDMFN